MRVRVDPERCQGHTLCAGTAPDVFALREEDGHAYVVDEEVDPAHRDAVWRASIGCPEQAIVVEE